MMYIIWYFANHKIQGYLVFGMSSHHSKFSLLYLFIYSFIYLPIYLSICLFIYLFCIPMPPPGQVQTALGPCLGSDLGPGLLGWLTERLRTARFPFMLWPVQLWFQVCGPPPPTRAADIVLAPVQERASASSSLLLCMVLTAQVLPILIWRK